MRYCLQRCIAFALALNVALGLANSAQAQSADEASREAGRALAYEGVAAYQRGEFKVAQDRLNRAYDLLKAPSAGLWSARALMKNGMWVEAAARLLEVSRLTVTSGKLEVQQKAKEDALLEREALLQKIPKVTLQIAGVDATAVSVKLDGKAVHPALLGVAQPVNPGPHSLVAKYRTQVRERSFEATEASAALVAFEFHDESAPPKTNLGGHRDNEALDHRRGTQAKVYRTVGWVTLGLGGAGIAAGGVLGLVAWSEKNTLNCGADNQCAFEKGAAVKTYNSRRSASTATLVGGAIASGVGITFLLLNPSPLPRTAGMELGLGLGTLAVSGRF